MCQPHRPLAGLLTVHNSAHSQALGWDVKELQLVTGGSISDASGMHQRTVKLLQAKVGQAAAQHHITPRHVQLIDHRSVTGSPLHMP